MADITDEIPASLKSLWNLETELRRAAQNAIFLRNGEASRHLEEARRHFNDALKSLKPGANAATSNAADSTAPPNNPTREG